MDYDLVFKENRYGRRVCTMVVLPDPDVSDVELDEIDEEEVLGDNGLDELDDGVQDDVADSDEESDAVAENSDMHKSKTKQRD